MGGFFRNILSVSNNNNVEEKNITSDTEAVDVIKLSNIHKSFGKFKLFDDFNFTIPDFKDRGQFISVLGASGCGKSVTLRLISGLDKPDSGKVELYGKPLGPKDSIPMVFQNYASLSWRTVLENVALPLELRGVGREEREAKAMDLIRLVGLEGKENNWGSRAALSGGQLQRVAIARSLIAQEEKVMLLLDEAMSGLDIITKNEMEQMLLEIYQKSQLDPTIISVCHDIQQSVYLSNRIYIMAANPGRIAHIIDIDLPEIRTPDVKQSSRFNDYVKEITSIMSNINNN
jgi:NitT/TauT family transport system ATP-binding protein